MLGGLYGDLPPPSDEDKPTNTTTTVWSIFAPPQTILKPQSKPKTTQNSLPIRPHSSPAIAPSLDDVVALPQLALVDVTLTVIKEHDPARPNDYEDYRREKKKKEVDAEISRELERRRQEEEEREMRERGNLVSTVLLWLMELQQLKMCHYQQWEDDSAALSEDQEPRTENGNGNNRRAFILPFPIDEWESRLDELEEHIARVEARFGRIQERMLLLRKALRVVSALFIVTLAYAIHK
ncbi:DNA-damage-repair/toleration protein DRT111 [Citrus sinensis]|uniref:DNA-damage-repair/toleration protein DRT111 n=1 Tax=Citrus sinensis TaxID=2711 RepID=A0ACB8KTC8_CITSI|nr:DNA-damage-repair/toleration protein DRT111 [Citrus sinensis]